MAKKTAKVTKFDPREYMIMAIAAMKKSIDEPRVDGKVSPKVGAVLVKPGGEVENAFRGELRHGDHAEFTLLERKNRANDLAGSILFATLEPCAPGARRHPKLGCAERIVNARIKEVWVGIADPDPDVDRKGIQYLKDHGIIVHMFDRDLQEQINHANKAFLKQALERADGITEIKKPIILTPIENVVPTIDKTWYSRDAINLYISKSKRKIKPFTPEFWHHFEAIGMVKIEIKSGKEIINPTGFGILLFGKEPRDQFPQAAVKAKVTYGSQKPSQEDFAMPLVLLPYAIENWLNKVLHSKLSRDSFQRKTTTDYPIEPLREAIINAIVHRDYDINGAKTYVEIDDEKIVIKSAGLPVEPISLDDVKLFKAPSLSRNPKITYIFNRMGLMEESELGMETFRTMKQKHKLPSPEYVYNAPYLNLTFARTTADLRKVISNHKFDGLTDSEIEGYEWIKTQDLVSPKDFAKQFNITPRTATRRLANLFIAGLIDTNGENIKSPKLKYSVKR